MKIFKSLVSIILVSLLVFSLAACGGNNDTNDNELTIGVSSAISTLDVNQEAGIINYYIAAIVSEGLIALGNDGAPHPGLALSWDSDDYTVWTFDLRPDAYFSDGTPVTIDDIIWSIERALDVTQSPGVNIHFGEQVIAVTRIDDTTLEITLAGPNPSFIWAVSNAGGLFVTSKAWGEEAGSIGSPADLILGSGPYKVTEFAPGSHVTLQAQDNWWGGTPEISNIRFDFITDEATRLLAFTQGSIDFALNIPIDQSNQWAGVDGAEVHFFADRSYYGLTIDVTVPPFDNVYVRQAVAHAVNSQGIVDAILGGHGTAATSITPPEQFSSVMPLEEARERLAATEHFSFNMEQAIGAFQQSGVEPFSTTIFYPDSFQDVGNASLIIAEALRELGIDATVTEIPLDQWLSEIGNGENGIAWMILFATSPEPSEMVRWLLSGGGPGTNPANFEDEVIANLITSVAAQSAVDGIDELLEAHSLAQEQVLYIPVWWGQAAIAWGERIDVIDFNSYTMLSQNWVQNFSFK